jgi:hypothetical protein
MRDGEGIGYDAHERFIMLHLRRQDDEVRHGSCKHRISLPETTWPARPVEEALSAR